MAKDDISVMKKTRDVTTLSLGLSPQMLCAGLCWRTGLLPWQQGEGRCRGATITAQQAPAWCPQTDTVWGSTAESQPWQGQAAGTGAGSEQKPLKGQPWHSLCPSFHPQPSPSLSRQRVGDMDPSSLGLGLLVKVQKYSKFLFSYICGYRVKNWGMWWFGWG